MPFMTQSDGRRIFYRAEGPEDAPAIVFSNSLGCDHLMWQSQADALHQSFKIVRYDQCGHGASDVPEGPYRLERLAEDVTDLADHLSIARFHFCGLSMGGLTGQWLGIHKPERLNKLVLANTSPHFPPPDMWDQRMGLLRDGGMRAISDAVLERFFSPALHAAQPVTVADFRRVLEHTDPQGYLGCCGMLREVDVFAELGEISADTLVISGQHDQSTPPERGEKIANAISGAQHVVLDAAHVSNVERPDEFTTALREFLEA